jgi:hypothetical protein
LSLFAKKLLGVGVATVVVIVLIGLYVVAWAKNVPPTIVAQSGPPPVASAHLTLQTDAAVGPQMSSSHPDWVGYLVLDKGRWRRSTIFQVPAHALVTVTIYQFDGDSGLRNPFLSQTQGLVGGTETIDGKPVSHIEPEEASHTFAVPSLGVLAPLPGVPEEAKNQCESGPCDPATMAHRTIQFTFRTGGKGRYRWQCFVPCAAGTYFGFGGPMQTLGYMDGYIDVV